MQAASTAPQLLSDAVTWCACLSSKELVKLLNVSEVDSFGLGFQHDIDNCLPPNKFPSIQVMPIMSYWPMFVLRLARTEITGGHGSPHTPIEAPSGGPTSSSVQV
ncbi:hypothetical protein B0H10DRAFT_2225395 [Mycena sp. CBHHK59/15]|nr:hypothetical protein B0H10DRAFT_2225395 [Mycena sp. CBHHK59/15]